MSKRDRNALIAGIALGIVTAGLSMAAVFAAGIVFVAFSIVNPLIVSLMAEKRIMSLAQAPNLVAFLILVPLVLIFLRSNPSMSHYNVGEILLGILVVLLMAVIPALLVSAVVRLIRKRNAPKKNTR